MKDIGFDIDTVARVPHCIQLCLIKVLAVLDDFDLIVSTYL